MNVRRVSLIAMAVVALGVAGCGSDDTSGDASTPAPTPTAVTTAPGTSTTAALDGKELFINGKASTGAIGCGGCHALKAAGTAGAVGPDLDKIATADDAEALAEMITDPNGEIVEGYTKDVMPQDYGTKLTPDEVQAIATYIDDNSAHAE